MPSWIHELVLIVIFSQGLSLFPGSGMVSGVSFVRFRAEWELVRASLSPLQFALIHAQEDYADLAKALAASGDPVALSAWGR